MTMTILVSTLGTTFYVIEKRQERLLFDQVTSQARILFKQIIVTRLWVAQHGNIYVKQVHRQKKGPADADRDDEIQDQSGRRYRKENPAEVTRELSKYARRTGEFWFHITSSKLVNPENAPDAFERKALRKFKTKKTKEWSTIEKRKRNSFFRYAAPLYAKPACIKCHKEYHVGDLRGAISITLPIGKLLSQVAGNKRTMVFGMVVISAQLFVALLLTMRAFIINPILKLKRLVEAYPGGEGATSDPVISSRDELGLLYRAFSEMRETINQYQRSLKEKIHAATQELQLTNSKLIETNQRYQELSNRKSEFISIISHELRTPLTSVKGAIDFIRSKLNMLNEERSDLQLDLKEVLQFLDVIGSNADRLVRMVNETLDLEKIESGREEFYFSEFSIGPFLRELVWEIDPILAEKEIALNTEVEEGLMVCADEDRMKEVMLNLLSNAIQHSPERSVITVEGRLNGPWVVVRVSDQGDGIPVEEQQKIFEKFYKRREGGTGLGLALCKSILEAHQGEIGIVSDGVRGSTFYFKLPAIKVEHGKPDSGDR
ncbi:MAG: DUF3365 domain-containing protein [Deltaproteobacteria bacterium]|nr:DUF3365 domain-containing protein [Deltaproteobacteria bacterium]